MLSQFTILISKIMASPPKEAAEFIASQAEHVTIVKDNIPKLGDLLVQRVQSGNLNPGNFGQVDVHPKSDQPWALDWILVADTLNFCFWHHEHQEGWKVEGKTGYFALCAALNRALKEKVDILNPSYYSVIKEDQLKKILRSDTKTECPLISKRLSCLHQVGNVLVEKFDGSFENLVKGANGSAVKLLNLIVENFQCFRDVSEYKGKRCAFYKRAQILVGDIWACFENKGIGSFFDIKEISAFADYRVPQTLLWYGVLEYSEDLLNVLKNNDLLKNGDQYEVEIRGCTIHAVELVTKYIAGKIDNGQINSILVDHFLWDFRRKHAKQVLEKGLPFHKTLCIFY